MAESSVAVAETEGKERDDASATAVLDDDDRKMMGVAVVVVLVNWPVVVDRR